MLINSHSSISSSHQQHHPLSQLEKGEMESEYSDEFSSDCDSESWISWFLSKKENKYLLQIPYNYIQDDFNLTELPSQVSHFREARALIMDDEGDEESSEESYDLEQLASLPEVQRSAHLLYYLVHQRYLITSQGMEEMSHKYVSGYFGICPRTLCNDTRLIPVGLSDIPGQHAFKLFCPSCVDVYIPSEPKFHVIDGCAWGTTFAHMFFMRFPEFWQAGSQDDGEEEGAESEHRNDFDSNTINTDEKWDDEAEFVGLEKVLIGDKVIRVYEPRIFGFRVHPSSPVALKQSSLRIRNNHITYLGQ